MQRLRPLTEDECYTRLYGKNARSAVNLVHSEAARPQIAAPSGDSLGRLLEARLDPRQAFGSEEAA